MNEINTTDCTRTGPWLQLILSGPLQSWGDASPYAERGTSMYPTRSALIGILLGALGVDRNDPESDLACKRMAGWRWECVQLTRSGLYRDYHTVQGARPFSAHVSGVLSDSFDGTDITNRKYLTDAQFIARVSGAPTEELQRLNAALRNPVWGGCLGRKACIPSRPIFGGVVEDAAVWPTTYNWLNMAELRRRDIPRSFRTREHATA